MAATTTATKNNNNDNNNEVLTLLNSIRGEMATKTDIARLQLEVTVLRAEKKAQTNQLGCLRTDVTNLRAEVEAFKKKSLDEMWEAALDTREEVWRCAGNTQQEVWDEARAIKTMVEETISEMKEDLWGYAVNTQQEIWDETKEIKKMVGDTIEVMRTDLLECTLGTHKEIRNQARGVKDKVGNVVNRVSRLTMKDEVRDAEAEELNDNSLAMMDRIERVEGRMRALAQKSEAPREDSRVSSAAKEKQKRTQGLWFANGE